MIDPGRESRVAKLLIWGGALAAVGFVAFVVLAVAGALAANSPRSGDRSISAVAGIPFMVFAIGVILLGSGMWQLWSGSKSKAKETTITESPGAWIISKFAIDRNGLMQFPADLDDDLVQDQGFKLYVRVEFPDGRRGEFRTSLFTYQTIGEGMKGTVRTQGDWLGEFKPEPRHPNDSPPALRG